MKKKFYIILVIVFLGTFPLSVSAHQTNHEAASQAACEAHNSPDSCDVITLKNGTEISCKVLDVSETEIKYKKCSNLSGPAYTKELSEVLFVKYSNGQKDVFSQNNTPKKEVKQDNSKKLSVRYSFWGPKFFRGDTKISRRVFMRLLEDNPNSALSAQNAATMNFLAITFYVISIIIILGLSILLGLLVYGIGAIFGLLGNSQLSKAVDKYNNSKK